MKKKKKIQTAYKQTLICVFLYVLPFTKKTQIHYLAQPNPSSLITIWLLLNEMKVL